MKRILFFCVILLVGLTGFSQPLQHTKPTTAYVLIVGPYDPAHPVNPQFPALNSQFTDERGGYFALYRITEAVADADKFNVEDWEVAIPPTRILPVNPSTPALTYMRANRVYVFQVSWYKQRLAIRYQLRYAPNIGQAPVYYGCQTELAPTGVCTEASMDNCWCDIAYTDEVVTDGCADPGAVGLFISGSEGAGCTPKTNPQQNQSFDNVKVYAFRPLPGDDSAYCGPPLPTSTPTRTPTRTITPRPTPIQ